MRGCLVLGSETESNDRVECPQRIVVEDLFDSFAKFESCLWTLVDRLGECARDQFDHDRWSDSIDLHRRNVVVENRDEHRCRGHTRFEDEGGFTSEKRKQQTAETVNVGLLGWLRTVETLGRCIGRCEHLRRHRSGRAHAFGDPKIGQKRFA